MNTYLVYGLIFVILLALELTYFKIADKFNIIDKPNERSSHSTIVLRGGGIIFLIGMWVWAATLLCGCLESSLDSNLSALSSCHPWFLIALTLVAGVSFVDDIHSLPDSVRLLVQFAAMGVMFYQLGMFTSDLWWMIMPALIVCVGASNIINFMDGINGITGTYTLATLIPALLLNQQDQFIDESMLVVAILSVIVFCIFNFREKGKAKCFAGDVGSLSAAFIMLFVIGLMVVKTMDPTWLVFLIIYGIDGVTTICHRILLHENLGEAHRKHTFQLMANELKMSHITVSLIFAGLQLAINLGFIYLCPNKVLAHWLYIFAILFVFGGLNLSFRKKYFHLHAEYLASLKNKELC